MASSLVQRSNWGSIAANLDPNVPQCIAISVLAGDPIQLRRLFFSIFGGTVNWRVLVIRGALPADLTPFTAWDSVNGVPANSGTVLGVDVQFEAIVPPGVVFGANLTDEPDSGPIAISGDSLSLLIAPLVTGPGLPKSYVAISAYGGAANPTQSDKNFRALPRFPQQYSPQSD